MKQLKQGVDQVVAGTQKELSEFQLKSRLKDLQEERTGKLAALGERVLQARSAEAVALADLSEEIAAVDGVDSSIREVQQQLEALQGP